MKGTKRIVIDLYNHKINKLYSLNTYILFHHIM